MTKYSVLDLVIVVDKSSFHQKDAIQIQIYFEERLKMKTDIHIYTRNLDEIVFDKRIKADLKKIF